MSRPGTYLRASIRRAKSRNMQPEYFLSAVDCYAYAIGVPSKTKCWRWLALFFHPKSISRQDEQMDRWTDGRLDGAALENLAAQAEGAENGGA